MERVWPSKQMPWADKEWTCKKKTSERGHQQTCYNCEGAPRDCGDSNSWPGASPVKATLLKNSHSGRSLWSQLEEASVVWWDQKNTKTHHHKYTVTFSVWSMAVAASSGPGRLVRVEVKMKEDKCRKILDENEPKRKPKVRQECLQNNNVNVLEFWQSPYLNTIGNLWLVLNKAVCSQFPCNWSKDERG